jgi:hypothetical protein
VKKSGSSLSLSALMNEEEPEVMPAAEQVQKAEEALPEDGALAARWKDLAGLYASQPRLANALANAKLEVRSADGLLTVDFALVNEAQKNWIAEKKLRELEERFQKLMDCPKIRLEPGVIPEEEQEKKIYMPVEKAQDLMSKNAEVSELVKDLALDIR